MRRTLLVITLLAIGLTGCGGGSKDTESRVTEATLADDTEQTWKVVSIKGNASFTGGGVDTPCPVTLRKADNNSYTFRCGSNDRIVLRRAGTFTYLGITGVSWNWNGSTVTLDVGSFGVLTGTVTIEPTAEGAPPRLRIRQTSRVNDGVRDPGDDGSETVIEELTAD